MTTTRLPNYWRWTDTAGRGHLIIEGTVIETSPVHAPAVTTLCGQQVHIGLRLIRRIGEKCEACEDGLLRRIEEALTTP